MKKSWKDYCFVIIGILLFGFGLFIIKTISNPQDIMQTLPYICIGVGCGIFGQGMGNIVSEKAMANYPDIKNN